MNITADEIRIRLAIDKSRLDDELELHSQVAEQITRKVTALELDVVYAKDDLKRYEAGMLIDIKGEETKQTEAMIDARIIRDNKRREAFKILVAYEEQLGTWKGLQAAWRDKSFNMRTLSDLHSSNYFDSVSSFNKKRDRNEDRGDYRAGLARQREQQTFAAEGDRPRRRME